MSGRLKETLKEGPTRVERVLQISIILIICGSIAILGRSAYDYFDQTRGRRSLNFAVWQPRDCSDDLHKNKMRQESVVGKQRRTIYVSLGSEADLNAFCQTQWDSKGLETISTLITPALDAVKHDIPDHRKHQSEEVDKFLIGKGAVDLVRFLNIARVLPTIYQAHVGKSGWEEGLNVLVSEKIRSLLNKFPWDQVISSNGNVGSTVELHRRRARPIEFISKQSSPVTLLELAAWLHYLTEQEQNLTEEERRILRPLPPIHADTRSDLATISDRVRSRSAENSSEVSNDRSFQVVLAAVSRPPACDAATLVAPELLLCPKDDRLFVEPAISVSSTTAATNSRRVPPLIPESLSDAVIQILADQP